MIVGEFVVLLLDVLLVLLVIECGLGVYVLNVYVVFVMFGDILLEVGWERFSCVIVGEFVVLLLVLCCVTKKCSQK